MKKDSTLKFIFLAVVGLLVLWIGKTILFTSNYGVGMNVRVYHGGGSMYMNGGYGTGGATITLLLTLLIKMLFVVFVAALVVGLFLAVKNYVFTKEDAVFFKGTFAEKSVTKKTCSICGKELDSEWKLCPHCGKEVEEVSEL